MWIVFFLLLLLAGCGYLSWHIWNILPFGNIGKWLLVGLLAACMVCFFTNFIFGLDNKPMAVASALYEVGNSSIFVALYLAMIFIALDLGRLARLIPKSFFYHNGVASLGIFLFVFGLFLYGNLHYYNKVRVPLVLKSAKPLSKPVRMVMMTDLHLGYHNRVDEFRKWIDKVNLEQPDLVLIGGDIVDGSIRAIREQGMAEEFRRLKAPVYACLGNHEYYGGRKEAMRFYEDASIRLLIDEVAKVTVRDGADTLIVIGRDDRTNKSRKSVRALMAEAPKGYYTILMDHQPYHLEEAEQAGIDFQLSGHTHHGQVWPVSWIEDLIYENAFGPLRKGKTDYYVSSGIGIWGGKFRIGTRSEYLVVDLK